MNPKIGKNLESLKLQAHWAPSLCVVGEQKGLVLWVSAPSRSSMAAAARHLPSPRLVSSALLRAMCALARLLFPSLSWLSFQPHSRRGKTHIEALPARVTWPKW